jgi:hypothetical protein
MLSECRTDSRLFQNFSLQLHSLFHTDVSVLSRDGTEHKINGRLRPNSELISKLNAVILQAKTNNTSLLRNKDEVSLFRDKFDDMLGRCKQHLENCVTDYPTNDDGTDPRLKWYAELHNHQFVLFRGTNANESYHRAIRRVFPEKCGEKLAEAIFSLHGFSWALKHEFNDTGICGCIGPATYDSYATGIETIDNINKRIAKICGNSDSSIPLNEEASFSTENYGFCYSNGDRRRPDYYNTLKAKDKKDNRLLSNRKKERQETRVVNANSSSKKQKLGVDEGSDEDENGKSVVKFGELGERSRMKFDNTLVDPYILDITTKKEYKVNRSINWDAVKQDFTKKFPQHRTVNSAQVKNLYHAALNRKAKATVEGSYIGAPGIIPHTITDTGVYENAELHGEHSTVDITGNEDENLELSDEVLMQIPLPLSPLQRAVAIAGNIYNTVIGSVVGTNIFQSSTSTKSAHDFQTPFQPVATLDIALKKGNAPKRFTSDENDCLNEMIKIFGDKPMHWDESKFGKASFPHKYHQLAQRKFNANDSLLLYERNVEPLKQRVKDLKKNGSK